MSSFAAYLEVQGVQYPLLTYTLMIHQETDALGRPASPTLGGTIHCVLAAPGSDQPFLVQWMFSSTMQQDGRVILMQDVPRTTLKTISFFNAYCTGLQTNFQPGAGGGGSLQMQVQISPQRVAVGAILHDNNWPVESHGAGQSFAKSVSYVDVQQQDLYSQVLHTGNVDVLVEEERSFAFIQNLSDEITINGTNDVSHYTFKGDDIDVTEDLKDKINSIANSFYDKTEKDLVITDGKRNPEAQAKAMFDKLEKGEDLTKLYSNQDAVTEIVDTYNSGKLNKDSDANIKEDMTTTIQQQVDKGNLISKHMSDKAFDVRSRTMDEKQVEDFKKSVEENGGTTVVEGDHLHVQFSD